MSWVVPGANPNQLGVQSVSAGTNISISGSTTNPIINDIYQGVQSVSAGTNISISGTATNPIVNATLNLQDVIPYTLSGTTAGAIITNRGIGAGNTITMNQFNLMTTISFNIPANWTSADSVYYDGWMLSDFDANFNSYWGVSYFTNTFPTPIDIIGSTTSTANALNYSNIQQIYLATNLIIPPTNLQAGGRITIRMYCNPTSTNHYLSIPIINQARIGLVKD